MTSIIGTRRDDVLYGTGANDVFDGLDGSDTILIGLDGGFDTFADTGLSGWDSVVASSAQVTIGLASGFGPGSGIEEIGSGGLAGVRIVGAADADVLDFSATVVTGIVSIGGGPGDDRITGSAGNDYVQGHNGSDTLHGGAGNDQMAGGAPNDFNPAINVLHGPDGDDVLDGGEGDDELAGGAGSDALQGGLGNDMLQGGSGADALTGGPGSDTFRFASTNDGGDWIADFEQGADRIDLARIDARTGTFAQDDAFVFGGQATGIHRNGVTFQVQDGATTVSMDVNGDRMADMVLTLAGGLTLTADDFIL